MLQPLYVVAHQQVSANSSSRFSGMQERTSKFFMLRRDSEGSDNRQDAKGAKEQQEQRHNRRGAEETQRKAITVKAEGAKKCRKELRI
ncbi:MAG TPA: hypothetical protein VFK51_07715 [Burkholderiales bacterium]|jgi:hypothetical protein|nr:hypothetical protein [Burkholderiales bacterium]